MNQSDPRDLAQVLHELGLDDLILCPGFRRIIVPRKACSYVAISEILLIHKSP